MPNIWMDVDTALPEVPVNIIALTDDGDFKTREESVTFDQADMDLVWNFVTTAGIHSQTVVVPTDTDGDYDWINQGNGMYTIEIPLSGGISINNNREGFGWFSGFATGILHWTGPIIGFRAAGLNNLLVDNAFSSTRGLTGTALPAVAADGVGGLPISDAGGLDLDTLLGTLTTLAAEGRSANLLDQLKTIIAVIESQRDDHTHQPGTGSILFVDGTNGDTHASGNRGGVSDPYKSIQDAHDNAGTDYGHDLYILVAGAAGATSSYLEDVTISDGYAFFRGPGRDLSQKPTANNTVAFTVTGDGVELSGFQLDDFDGTGAQHGIQITDADFAYVHDIWFNQTRGDGVNILRGMFCLVCDSNFEGTGVEANGQGIHITGTGPGVASENRICRNHMSNTGGDSILVENGTTNDTIIYDNVIHDSVAWAINIGGSSTDALIHGNIFGNNSSGNITDAGTTTIDVNNVPWLYSTTPNRSLDVTTGGAAGVDWSNVENKGATVDLSETVIKLCDTVTTNTDVRGTDSAALASVWTVARAGALTDWIDAGRLDLLLDAIKAKTDGLNFTGNDVKATLDGETVVTDAASRTASKATGFAVAGDNMAMSASERNALADALLLRNVSNVEATAGDHSLCYVVLAMSESDTTTNANKLTVFKTDGTTEFVQKTITTDAAADPLTKVE